MIIRNYKGVYGLGINSLFPGCLPCNCYNIPDQNGNLPTYEVTVYYCPTSKVALVIAVRCDRCKQRGRYDVEHYNIHESKIQKLIS